MTYTPIVPGSENWDVPVNAAFTDQDTRIDTKVSKSGDTLTGPLNGTSFVSTGTSEFMNIRLGAAGTFGGGTGAVMAIANAGTVPTGAPSGVAVYSEAGVFKIRQNNGTVVDTSNITTNSSRTTALEQSTWMPVDYSMQGWSYDPANTGANFPMITGVIYMSKVKLAPGTVSALGTAISIIGSGLTAGQSFMALYNNSGTLLGQTADQSAAWAASPTYSQPALVTPVTISTAGYYHVAMFSNGTTPPQIIRGSNLTANTNLVNPNLNAAGARFASAGTATTAPPASITMSSRTPMSQALWFTAA